MQPFEGERIIPLPPEQLWPKLRDAGFLATCIPDGTPHAGPTRDKAVCTVHPGFSFMRGSIDVTIEVIGGQEPTAIQYSQKSKGIGTSSEVETAIYHHEAVAEAAVFGIPDQRLGEEVAAAIVLRPGHTLSTEALTEFLAASLAKYKIPARVWFRTEPIPRNASGKFLKRELRDELLKNDTLKG